MEKGGRRTYLLDVSDSEINNHVEHLRFSWVGVTCEVGANLFAVFGDSCSQRVLTVVLSCAHDGQQPGARHPVPLHNYLDLDHLRGTICDCPSLIKHHCLDLR